MATVKRLIAAVSFAMVLDASARMSDGMYFDLKCQGDANGNGRMDLSEVVNALAIGADGGGAAIHGNPADNPSSHEPICFTEETAWRAFYHLASPIRTALRLPQSYYESDDGVYHYQDSVVFANAKATEACDQGRTLFVRFYWEGHAYPGKPARQAFIVSDSWSYGANNGYALTLAPYGSDTGLMVWVGNRNNFVKRGSSIALINSNQWYDVVIRLDQSGGTTKVRTTFGTIGYHDVWDGTALLTQSLSPKSDGQLVIGAENVDSGTVRFPASDANSPNVFKGRIAELKVWNRSLSDEELGAVFRNISGESVTVGVVNGSSDEFGAAPAEVFDPQTMAWDQMRKELTAEHPSLKLAMAFPREEAEIGKTLLVTPVLGDVESCDVELLVNGSPVAEARLNDGVETPLHIRNRRWKADADGKVQLELRRTGDLTGTLGIDALSLGGSWQLGLQDNSWTDFAWENDKDAFADYFVGDPDTTNHLRRAVFEVGGSSSKTQIAINFYCPASIKDFGSKLTVRLLNKAGQASEAIPYTFMVNSEHTFNCSLARYDSVTLDIPPGTFKAGYNSITVEHHATTPDSWAGMDFYRLEFECPRPGMVVSVR